MFELRWYGQPDRIYDTRLQYRELKETDQGWEVLHDWEDIPTVLEEKPKEK